MIRMKGRYPTPILDVDADSASDGSYGRCLQSSRAVHFSRPSILFALFANTAYNPRYCHSILNV
jgi:hypothetical protein